MLSPSGEVFVCPGSQFSFRCSTNSSFLEWNITAYQSNVSHRYIVTSMAISQSNVQLTIHGHLFSITRISATGSLPIVSVMTVANVLDNYMMSVNGTRIRCTGREVDSSVSENSTSVAIIHIIMPSQGTYTLHLTVIARIIKWSFS